jgi:hypothetical protein
MYCMVPAPCLSPEYKYRRYRTVSYRVGYVRYTYFIQIIDREQLQNDPDIILEVVPPVCLIVCRIYAPIQQKYSSAPRFLHVNELVRAKNAPLSPGMHA